MRLHATLFPAAMTILLAVGSASAQEWTRFRGPNGSGVNDSISIPPVWTEKDYRWKITLPGGGHSSPVLWGDKLFITCADDATGTRSLLGINATDGKTLWHADFPFKDFKQHQDNSYASATPAVDADGVYLCWNTPEEFTIYGFDHSGKQLWKTDLGPFISEHGGGNSPIVVGDIVLLGDDQEGRDSYLFGLNRITGKIVWKLKRNSTKFSAATPVLLQASSASPLAVFTSRNEGMTAVDPMTGKISWAVPTAFDARTISSPVLGNNVIFATCGEGGVGHGIVAVRPPGTSGATASVAFKISSSRDYVPTPLMHGDLLFALTDSGSLACYRASTGQPLWQQKIAGTFYSSPICAKDTLFLVSRRGTVLSFAASEEFKPLGKTELGEKSHATPALANGCIFVRAYTQLVCVNGTAGK